MKIAVPVWNGRVSTVFETADELVVIDSVPGGDRVRRVESLDDGATRLDRASCLRDMGIDVLICGALSRSMAHRIEAAGIRVIPFVRGPVDEVVGAFREGRLEGERYFLPGCRARAGTGGTRRRGRRVPGDQDKES
jgi:predicted Fe-Mo cluster-binding NifX family protein